MLELAGAHRPTDQHSLKRVAYCPHQMPIRASEYSPSLSTRQVCSRPAARELRARVPERLPITLSAEIEGFVVELAP
jgi:hypothetical protein